MAAVRASKSNVSEADAAWQKALRWLAAHERSAHEIAARLAAAGVASELVDATLQRLIEKRFVDDRRCAAQVADALRRRGHGSQRARHDLQARGIAPSVAEPVVAELFADERQLAEQVLAQRFPQLTPTERDRAKAARFLVGRGFPEELVLAILEAGC